MLHHVAYCSLHYITVYDIQCHRALMPISLYAIVLCMITWEYMLDLCRGGIRTGHASGYKKPEVLGVAGLRRQPGRQLRAGLEVLLIEVAGTKILGQCIIQCAVHTA